MADFCHDFEEYDQTVGKSSKPIQTEKIFEAVAENLSEQIEDITEQSQKEGETMKVLFGN